MEKIEEDKETNPSTIFGIHEIRPDLRGKLSQLSVSASAVLRLK